MEIRNVKASDIEGVARLMIELERHYTLQAPPFEEVVPRLARLLEAGIEMRLAIEDGEPVGCISFGMLFPGVGLLPTLYLKEIFVSARARGRGVGRRLLSVLAEIAIERRCQRIDWTTSRDNHSARQLYEAVGAKAQEDKIGYRLDGAAMAALAASDKDDRHRIEAVCHLPEVSEKSS